MTEEQVPEQIQEPIQEQPSVASPEAQTVAVMQQVKVEMPGQRGYRVVEASRWDRLEDRVQKLGRRSVDWLAAGWAFFGVAGAAGIALLVLPHVTKGGEQISAWVRPTLWALVFGGAILWAVFAAFHFSTSHHGSENAHDICNEMRVARGAEQLPPPSPWWKKAWAKRPRRGKLGCGVRCRTFDPRVVTALARVTTYNGDFERHKRARPQFADSLDQRGRETFLHPRNISTGGGGVRLVPIRYRTASASIILTSGSRASTTIRPTASTDCRGAATPPITSCWSIAARMARLSFWGSPK